MKGVIVRILSLLWQIPHFHFIQVEQLITHLVQSVSTFCGTIGAMFHGFLVLPLKPIKEALFESKSWEWEQERRRKKGCNRSSLVAIAVAVNTAMRTWSWVRVYVILLLYAFILYPFSISNNMDFSCECKQFDEPR